MSKVDNSSSSAKAVEPPGQARWREVVAGAVEMLVPAHDTTVSTEPDGRLSEITPRDLHGLIDCREVWQYRELLLILAARDIRVRYKQTVVGALWVLLQPLATMAIFLVLFRSLGRFPASGEIPYGLTVLGALLPWQFFATAVNQSSGSLVANQALITKAYFPRVLLPLSAVLGGIVEFGINLALLLSIMCFCRVGLSWQILLFPLFCGLLLVTALGLGLWLSALNALYRDIGHVLPFVMQAGFFLSPVVYETRSLIPERWQTVYALNPLCSVLDGFRWCLLNGAAPSWMMLVSSTVAAGLLALSGSAYFRRMERVLADRI